MEVGEPNEAAVDNVAGVSAYVSGALERISRSGRRSVRFTPATPSNTQAYPELDCIRHLFSPAVIDSAERRSARLGIGADRVLIAAGHIDEETYLRMLGPQLGLGFEPLDGAPRTICPFPDDRLIESAATGLLPLIEDNELVLTIAPRAMAAHRLAGFLHPDHPLARRFRLTTSTRLNEFVLRYGATAIAARASTALGEAHPMLSAGPLSRRRHRVLISGTAMALTALTSALLMPHVAWRVLAATLAVVFLSWLSLRLAAVFIPAPAEPQTSDFSDEALPIYSIIAALYQEATSINDLLEALEQLDYPAEKLDVILALEESDRETRAAVAARKHRIPITVVTVPTVGPRTKPKALNTALPFARGRFTVVYDAEDRPERDQLRRALHAFRSGGDDLACVQARLCIHNVADGKLVRLFAAEYAGQFDVFLPGVCALSLPLPLGGSSNHFRTSILRAIGGWDSFNVTEDADIGIRLARFGYRVSMIDSTTYEEAPAHVRPWLRQRTRWFKGWTQTWLVHMRQPRRLVRELGWAGFLGFQLCVGGNVLAALVHPFFLGILIAAPFTGLPLWTAHSNLGMALSGLYVAAASAGYAVSAFTAWVGLKRRGLQRIAWVLLLIPAHWVLLSLAAWRALYQCVTAPYTWEKTPHGMTKRSRRTASTAPSIDDVEAYLRRLKARVATDRP